MKKFIQKKLRNEKGMTLIELLAVIVIIAIIAAIAIPAIGNIIENSRHGAVKADFQNAIAAANLYKTEQGSLPADITVLETQMDDVGSLTEVTFGTNTNGATTVLGKAVAPNGDGYTIDTTAVSNNDLSGLTNEAFGTAYKD